jgi:hypothetical protein
MASAPSLQQRLDRLTTEQLAHVDRLVADLERSGQGVALQPRQPGGLLGLMHTHDDFDAPMDEAFLQS